MNPKIMGNAIGYNNKVHEKISEFHELIGYRVGEGRG